MAKSKKNKALSIVLVALATFNTALLVVILNTRQEPMQDSEMLKKLAQYAEWNAFNSCLFGAQMNEEDPTVCLSAYLDEDKQFVDRLKDFVDQHGIEVELEDTNSLEAQPSTKI